MGVFTYHARDTRRAEGVPVCGARACVIVTAIVCVWDHGHREGEEDESRRMDLRFASIHPSIQTIQTDT